MGWESLVTEKHFSSSSHRRALMGGGFVGFGKVWKNNISIIVSDVEWEKIETSLFWSLIYDDKIKIKAHFSRSNSLVKFIIRLLNPHRSIAVLHLIIIIPITKRLYEKLKMMDRLISMEKVLIDLSMFGGGIIESWISITDKVHQQCCLQREKSTCYFH